MVHLCWEVKPRRILDIGPGHGKAGILLREYIGTVAAGTGPIERVDAIEAEPRYLKRFRWLESVYDRVMVGDACELSQDALDCYDLVLMADVIEHLDYRQASALLERICGHVVISTPADFFQNPEADDFPSERHRSHWSAADFGSRVERLDADALKQLGCVLVRLSERARPATPPPSP